MSGCLCLRSDAVVSPEVNAVAPKIATSTSNKTELDGITLTGVSLSFLQRLRAGAVKKRAAAGGVHSRTMSQPFQFSGCSATQAAASARCLRHC